MTRINLGVDPEELCDQHLIAEHHELPRMWPFAWGRAEKYGGGGPRPDKFTLGTGHMAFFLPYGPYLEFRLQVLREEMRARGFAVGRETYGRYPFRGHMAREHMAYARPLLIARIADRLTTAKRVPRWTLRDVPSWALLAFYSPHCA